MQQQVNNDAQMAAVMQQRYNQQMPRVQQQVIYAQPMMAGYAPMPYGAFVPPNTRGRLSVTIAQVISFASFPTNFPFKSFYVFSS